MTTWRQASGNPFGPPDDDGDVGLGAAFGAVDPAPADARFGTQPAPAPAPHAREPAAPSAVPDAFATAPSYDQMFGGADATPLVPSKTVGAPHPAPAMPSPPPTAEPAPPPPVRVAHPPREAALEVFAPPAAAFPLGAASVSSEDAFASIGAVNTIRGDASTTTHERAPPRGPDGSPATPKTSPSPEAPSPPRMRTLETILPRSPQSPRATVFVPAPAGPGPGEDDEKRALFVHGSAHELIASSRDDDDDDDANEELSGGFRLRRRPNEDEDEDENENETSPPGEKDNLSAAASSAERASQTKTKRCDDDPADPADSPVEALASAAATAASSARRLEARVRELDAELEAYRIGADDAARALAEKEATVSALRAELERNETGRVPDPKEERREKENARLLDRLEKATRALDRERAASKKAEALASAATRRAAEAELASRETLARAVTLERLNVEAEARAARLATDVSEANRVAAEAMLKKRETERLRETDVFEDVPKTSSSSREDDAFVSSSVRLEVRVAPDADALLAREAAASRLKAEAEAISSASARLVEKLVRENGALVERMERMQTRDSFARETSPNARETKTSSARSSRETSPARQGRVPSTSHETKTKTSSAKKNEISEEPPRPRGLWAFITGADRAPAKYVPRRAAEAK